MAEAMQFARLLRELRAVSSPLQRVKLLGRAWKTLRRLDRDQLTQLASQAGFDQAEGFLERLGARRGRLTPGLVKQLMQRVRHLHPEEVDGILRGLRDPRQRRELLDEGLDRVERMLAGDEPEAAEPEAAASRNGAPDADLGSDRDVAAPARVAAGTAPAGAARPSRPAPLLTSPRRVPPAAPPRIAPAASRGHGSRIPAPTTGAVVVPRASVRTPPAVTLDAPVDVDDLLQRLERCGTRIQRLRLLRSELSGLAGCEVGDLQRLVEAFAAGWSRRRAASAVLGSGAVRGLGDGERLIATLETRAGRRWCASALVHAGTLAPSERDELIERYGLFRRRAPRADRRIASGSR